MTVTGSETRPRLRPTEHHADQPRPWRPPASPSLTAGDRLLRAAERAVGRLAPTLRTALLMLLVAIAGIAFIAATAGLLAAVLSTLVLVGLALLRR